MGDMSVNIDYKSREKEEEGEFRCSDLDVPLLTKETFKDVVKKYLSKITFDQWSLLSTGKMDQATEAVLDQLDRKVVEMVSTAILDVVEPQVYEWSRNKRAMAGEKACGYETWKELKALPTESNYTTVTVEDVEACIGDALNHSLSEAVGVQECLNNSESTKQLRKLIGVEVTKRVNLSLDLMKMGSSLEQSKMVVRCKVAGLDTKKMVACTAQTLSSYTKKSSHATDEEEKSCSSDFFETISKDSSTDLSGSQEEASKEFQKKQQTFLTMFLGKLLDHVAQSSESFSVADVNFDEILENLSEIIEGEQNFIPPQTVGNLHVNIFTNLCQTFGSAKKLQDTITARDMTFEEEVARELMHVMLQNSKTNSKVSGKSRNTADKELDSKVLSMDIARRPLTKKKYSMMRKLLTCCTITGSKVIDPHVKQQFHNTDVLS
ncbi:uncharacterized protein ACB058_000378 [Synchiropus picturatus]